MKIYIYIYEKVQKMNTYMDVQGRVYKLSIFNNNISVSVKLYGIPYEMKDEEIKKTLDVYGSIDNIREEKWRDIGFEIYNETVTTRMEVRRLISSFVRILGK